jgi:hypothetical protein
VCCSSKRETVFGNTDHNKISTSHVERQNLNIRMGNRRFTRLTNAFSKRLEAHADMLAVYFFHYNFCRNHKTLGMTPAQAARLTDERLSMEDLVKLMDARAAKPVRPATYKKQAAEAENSN